MSIMLRWLTLSFCLVVTNSAFSAEHGQAGLFGYEFNTEQDEERFRDLASKLRCLVCQNQNLLDSDAELAADLRDETYKLFRLGQSNEEIKGFLVDRYGDFVLYDPPFKPSTYFLWFGPFALLAIGIVILVRSVRGQTPQRVSEMSDEERRRVEKLLADTSGKPASSGGNHE